MLFRLRNFLNITTNFLAGALIYRLSSQGLAERQSRVRLFRQGMEVPYVLFDRPDVVIRAGGVEEWDRHYAYDILVVTDDAPFFYKYYRLLSFNPFQVSRHHHLGSIMFLTQVLVLLQALLFILIFILLPLWVFKRKSAPFLPRALSCS